VADERVTAFHRTEDVAPVTDGDRDLRGGIDLHPADGIDGVGIADAAADDLVQHDGVHEVPEANGSERSSWMRLSPFFTIPSRVIWLVTISALGYAAGETSLPCQWSQWKCVLTT
jgi:hypothetical protein